MADYDATYALTHLLRTAQEASATTKGPKFDATTAFAAILKAAPVMPPPTPSIPVGSTVAPAPYRVEAPKDKDKDKDKTK